MKKIIFIGFCLFLVGCNTSTETGGKAEDGQNSIETALFHEVENQDFKLVVKGGKTHFSLNQTIVITAELHYIGLEDEIEVYSNASLLDYTIENDAGTFYLASEGEDSHHTYVIKKDEPLVETFEFDKNDDSFGKLLEPMELGNYTMYIRATYGKEDIRDERQLEAELNFEITEPKETANSENYDLAGVIAE